MHIRTLPSTSLGEALGAPHLPWRTGKREWKGHTSFQDEENNLASVSVPEQETAWIETDVQGPGELHFLSTDPSTLQITVNQIELPSELVVTQTQAHFPSSIVVGPGEHTIRWAIVPSDTPLTTAILDDVRFETDSTTAKALDIEPRFMLVQGAFTYSNVLDGEDALLAETDEDGQPLTPRALVIPLASNSESTEVRVLNPEGIWVNEPFPPGERMIQLQNPLGIDRLLIEPYQWAPDAPLSTWDSPVPLEASGDLHWLVDQESVIHTKALLPTNAGELSTHVFGPGTLRFQWKGSSRFVPLLNGQLIPHLTPQAQWQTVEIPMAHGNHCFSWQLTGTSESEPSYAALSQIEWETADSPIAKALDWSPGHWMTWNGEATSQSLITHDGSDALQIDGKTGTGVAAFRFTEEGPGMLAFWIRKQHYGLVSISLNGVIFESYDTYFLDWQQVRLPLANGPNEVTVRFESNHPEARLWLDAFAMNHQEVVPVNAVLDNDLLAFELTSSKAGGGWGAFTDQKPEHRDYLWSSGSAYREVRVSLEGPGTLEFDLLHVNSVHLYINGMRLPLASRYRKEAWSSHLFSLGEGTHTIRWRPSWSQTTGIGLDAVRWTSDSAILHQTLDTSVSAVSFIAIDKSEWEILPEQLLATFDDSRIYLRTDRVGEIEADAIGQQATTKLSISSTIASRTTSSSISVADGDRASVSHPLERSILRPGTFEIEILSESLYSLAGQGLLLDSLDLSEQISLLEAVDLPNEANVVQFSDIIGTRNADDRRYLMLLPNTSTRPSLEIEIDGPGWLTFEWRGTLKIDRSDDPVQLHGRSHEWKSGLLAIPDSPVILSWHSGVSIDNIQFKEERVPILDFFDLPPGSKVDLLGGEWNEGVDALKLHSDRDSLALESSLPGILAYDRDSEQEYHLFRDPPNKKRFDSIYGSVIDSPRFLMPGTIHEAFEGRLSWDLNTPDAWVWHPHPDGGGVMSAQRYVVNPSFPWSRTAELSTTIQGPGEIRFSWVREMGPPSFRVDGDVWLESWSVSTNNGQYTQSIPAGEHTLSWVASTGTAILEPGPTMFLTDVQFIEHSEETWGNALDLPDELVVFGSSTAISRDVSEHCDGEDSLRMESSGSRFSIRVPSAGRLAFQRKGGSLSVEAPHEMTFLASDNWVESSIVIPPSVEELYDPWEEDEYFTIHLRADTLAWLDQMTFHPFVGLLDISEASVLGNPIVLSPETCWEGAAFSNESTILMYRPCDNNDEDKKTIEWQLRGPGHVSFVTGGPDCALKVQLNGEERATLHGYHHVEMSIPDGEHRLRFESRVSNYSGRSKRWVADLAFNNHRVEWLDAMELPTGSDVVGVSPLPFGVVTGEEFLNGSAFKMTPYSQLAIGFEQGDLVSYKAETTGPGNPPEVALRSTNGTERVRLPKQALHAEYHRLPHPGTRVTWTLHGDVDLVLDQMVSATFEEVPVEGNDSTIMWSTSEASPWLGVPKNLTPDGSVHYHYDGGSDTAWIEARVEGPGVLSFRAPYEGPWDLIINGIECSLPHDRANRGTVYTEVHLPAVDTHVIRWYSRRVDAVKIHDVRFTPGPTPLTGHLGTSFPVAFHRPEHSEHWTASRLGNDISEVMIPATSASHALSFYTPDPIRFDARVINDRVSDDSLVMQRSSGLPVRVTEQWQQFTQLESPFYLYSQETTAIRNVEILTTGELTNDESVGALLDNEKYTFTMSENLGAHSATIGERDMLAIIQTAESSAWIETLVKGPSELRTQIEIERGSINLLIDGEPLSDRIGRGQWELIVAIPSGVHSVRYSVPVNFLGMVDAFRVLPFEDSLLHALDLGEDLSLIAWHSPQEAIIVQSDRSRDGMGSVQVENAGAMKWQMHWPHEAGELHGRIAKSQTAKWEVTSEWVHRDLGVYWLDQFYLMPYPSAQDALDSFLSFEEGDHPNHPRVPGAEEDADSLVINDYLATYLEGPGEISFWWKGRGRPWESADWSVNQSIIDRKTGETPWEFVRLMLPDGPNVVRWDSGQLDQIQYVPQGSLTSFENWALSYGLRDALADPNGDGVNNYLSYTFGIDPFTGRDDEGALPQIRELVTGDAELRLVLEYERRVSRRDQYQPRFSGDLKNWTTEIFLESVMDRGNGWENVQVWDSTAIPKEGRRFGHIHVRIE